jgi:hypothetical protein
MYANMFKSKNWYKVIRNGQVILIHSRHLSWSYRFKVVIVSWFDFFNPVLRVCRLSVWYSSVIFQNQFVFCTSYKLNLSISNWITMILCIVRHTSPYVSAIASSKLKSHFILKTNRMISHQCTLTCSKVRIDTRWFEMAKLSWSIPQC